MIISIPQYILDILAKLESFGFEAYVVGGCVRDILMGKIPSDWDVATSSRPENTQLIFKDFKTIATGLKHGTVTVISEGHPVEITTYRIDGEYTDNRRPDNVTFSQNLSDDLSRRDFTINAMAYNPRIGLVDLFCGQEDLKNKIIRCVGDPETRFFEDSLRIMRAIRFSAVCGLEIAEETSSALVKCRHLLENVSAERIASELNKIMLSPNPTRVLTKYSQIFKQLLPETQCNETTVSMLESSIPSLPLRLALLFYGKSPSEALSALTRLKYDNKTKNTVKFLLSHCNDIIKPNRIALRKAISELGVDNFGLLLALWHAVKIDISKLEQIYKDIIIEGDCVTLSQLKICGYDLINKFGLNGRDVGNALNFLLNCVIEDKCENNREKLIEYYSEIII